MEGRQRLLQLLAFTTGPAIDVVQHYFEFKIIRQGTDFKDYLNDQQNKHKLFHERYPKLPCCGCIPISIAAPSKRGCLGYQQFSKLYDENGPVTAGHEQTNGSQISQHCICKVSAQQSIKVIDIDITLLNAIIQHCCPLHITTKIAPWMKVIKEERDTISHWPKGQLEKNMFDQIWKKLEKATLQCAGDIGHTSVKIFQMTIDSITTCSVNDLGKRILQTIDKLSGVHKDLNGIIATVQSILSKQDEICDQLCSNSKDLTEVKTFVSGVNTVIERTKDVMEKVNIKTEEIKKIKEDVGNVKHRLERIDFMISMIINWQGENPEEYVRGKKARNVALGVNATSPALNDERTVRNFKDEMNENEEPGDNDHHDDNRGYAVKNVEKKCIHLELSASPGVFQSPQRLRIAIKSLIRQFVKAGELDENVPATVTINITVKSALTTEEKNVVYTVFSDNDTLDGPNYDEKLQIEQTPRLLVKASTIEPDHQIASTSASEIIYSRHKIESFSGVGIKTERREDPIDRMSVHLENVKFNLLIRGFPRSLSKSSNTKPEIISEESTDFCVFWTWHYTKKQPQWDVVSIVDTINSRISNLRDWFHVEFAKSDISGRLTLQTTTASHTFSSLPSLEMAAQSFLEKFIEVCDLKKYLEEEQLIYIDVTSQPNENKVVDENDETMRKEVDMFVDTVVTCDDCKKDLICTVCRSNDSLITRLNYKLEVQRNTIMRLETRMSTVGEQLEGFDDEVYPTDEETEDMDLEDTVMRKRKRQTEVSTGVPEITEKTFKKLKMSTSTENESTDTEFLKDLQEFVIDKEKALQKLGEIPLIDMKIKEGQRKRNRWKSSMKYARIAVGSRKSDQTLYGQEYLKLSVDGCLSDLRRERKYRSGIAKALAEIVSTNSDKRVSTEDKRYLEDLDFLKVNFKQLRNTCQQCGSQDRDITGTCTICIRIFCEDCFREHTKKFPDHEYVFRDDIIRGLEYYGDIVPRIGEVGQYQLYNTRVVDMKSGKGMVVIMMVKNLNYYLQVFNPVMQHQIKWQNHLTMELDRHNSQITIIDDNTVAITAPCTRHIHIVNFKTDMITKINCTTEMTGAIAFIDKNLYVACTGQIRKMNLQGKEILSIDVPSIQFLQPVGQTKLYCVRSYPNKNVSYLDMTNEEEHELSEFPFHPGRFTSDDSGNIYFISNDVVLKAAHDGSDYKVVLSNGVESCNPKRISFDISNKMFFVQTLDRTISIYQKV